MPELHESLYQKKLVSVKDVTKFLDSKVGTEKQESIIFIDIGARMLAIDH